MTSGEVLKDAGTRRLSRLPVFLAAVLVLLVLIGAYAFLSGTRGVEPLRAWQIFMVNLLFWGGLAAGVFSALGIGYLTRHEKIREDTAIGVVFAAMFALGIAMISRIDNYAGDLSHILFGQILGVSRGDLQLIAAFGLVVLALVALFFKEFMIISFDPTLARTLRLPADLFRLLLLVLIAVAIVVSLQTVGIALMVALLVTPAATANLMTRRLLPMMAVSALIGAASSILGFYLSYHQDIATGPAIVLIATAIFIFVFAEQQVRQMSAQIVQRWRERWAAWRSHQRAAAAPDLTLPRN